MSISRRSLAQSVYNSIYHVIESVLNKNIIIEDENDTLELIHRNGSSSLYHAGEVLTFKDEPMLSFDFCVAQITEDDFETQVTLSFSLVKYFNSMVIYHPRFLTSVMRYLGNHGLPALEKEIKDALTSMKMKKDYTITRSNVSVLFSVITLPEGAKNASIFIEGGDDNCLQVNIEMSLINEKDYEVGGSAYIKRKEHFDSMKK